MLLPEKEFGGVGSGLVPPIEVVIPTQLPSSSLTKLVEQMRVTADYHHKVLFTGFKGSASTNRNLGLKQCQGEMVVMVDDDIEFTSRCHGWLRVLVQALSRPEVLMVSAQLLTPQGKFAYMTGLDDCGLKPRTQGESVVPSRKLLTACCGFKHMGLRFDERFIGSGFEDLDWCNQLAEARPDGIFLICHSALAVHRNECKNQRGSYWQHNKLYYQQKWGKQ